MRILKMLQCFWCGHDFTYGDDPHNNILFCDHCKQCWPDKDSGDSELAVYGLKKLLSKYLLRSWLKEKCRECGKRGCTAHNLDDDIPF